MNIPPPANRSRVVPNPNAINMPTVGKKFYVVTQGEEAGIFGSWCVPSFFGLNPF